MGKRKRKLSASELVHDLWRVKQANRELLDEVGFHGAKKVDEAFTQDGYGLTLGISTWDVGPTATVSPIVASQAAIAKALGRSPHTARLLEKLKGDGMVSHYETVGSKSHVWFVDPAEHERIRQKIADSDRKSWNFVE
jgi:hypothetical protein